MSSYKVKASIVIDKDTSNNTINFYKGNFKVRWIDLSPKDQSLILKQMLMSYRYYSNLKKNSI